MIQRIQAQGAWVYGAHPVPRRPVDIPRFQGEAPPEKNGSKGIFRRFYDNFYYNTALATLVTKVTGSVMLMASCLIPGSGKEENVHHAPAVQAVAAQIPGQVTKAGQPHFQTVHVTPDGDMKAQLAKLKSLLKSLGLGTITVGIFTGSLSEIGVGIKQKQPTVALTSTAFLLATPLFYYDSNFTRGLYLTLLGAYYSGYANVVRNKFQKPAPEKLQESEVSAQNLSGMTEHVIGDQLRVLSTVPRSPEMLKNVVTDTVKALEDLKNGKPLSLAPHSDRVLISSLGHFAGGGMLMLAGADPWMALAGSTIASVSSLSSNMEWFAIGTQRKDWVGAALKAGVPLCVLGKCLFFTNLGYSAEKLGQGLTFAMSLDLVDETKKEKAPPTEAEPPPEPPKTK